MVHNIDSSRKIKENEKKYIARICVGEQFLYSGINDRQNDMAGRGYWWKGTSVSVDSRQSFQEV